MKNVSKILLLIAFGIIASSLITLVCADVSSGSGKMTLPSKDDLRHRLLESVVVESMKFNDVTINDFCDRIKITRNLKCSLVLRSHVEDVRFSLSFGGGSLKQLLEQLVMEVPVSIGFEPIAVVFDKAEKFKK